MVDIGSRLDEKEARKLLSQILKTGSLAYWKHAEDQMTERNLTKNDVLNVLRGGHITEPGEWEGASWRYRVHTDRMCAVVAFADLTHAAVVTAWRKER
jgi:hypothetical protein